MRLTTILMFLCAIVFGVSAQAVKVVSFTPEELYRAIDERSSTLRLANLMVEDARQGEAVAKNGYLPDVKASWEVGYLGDGYLTDRNFSNGMHVKNPHFVNNFAIEAAQTIYSGGAVTQGVKMAELRTRMSELSLRADRQQVRFLLLSRLIDLQCQHKQRAVIEQNIALAEQMLKLMESRLEIGVILENDLTRYQLQIADLQLQRDRIDEAITVNNAAIATALGYEEGTQFELQVDAIDENYPVNTLPAWLSEASAGSLSLSKARLGIDMSKVGLRLAKAEKLPYVGAFIYGHFDSPIVTEVPVLNKNFMYWGFGVHASYNISSLFKTDRKLKQAKIGVAESEERLEVVSESVTDQVTAAYEALRTSQSELRTQRYSLNLANQNYDIVSNRFIEGMALVTDLVDAANVKIAAQTGVQNAQSKILYCLYKLKYITNTL